MKIPAKGFTHGGKFHADDVFSTALLQILRPDIQVTRGFVVPDDFDGIVYDVGGGMFDHHSEPRECRPNGVPYAAFEQVRHMAEVAGAKVADAVKYDAISYDQVLADHLQVMDLTATSLAMENHIPVMIFALADPQNILRAVMGERIGTIVEEETKS